MMLFFLVLAGQDWRARMMEWDKENQGAGGGGGGGGDRKNVPPGALMEFSPPSKMPKNSPSYLIWSIFTREKLVLFCLTSVLMNHWVVKFQNIFGSTLIKFNVIFFIGLVKRYVEIFFVYRL